MQIVFISRHYGKAYRGAETYVHELSTNLRKLGHDIKIVNSVFELDSKTKIVIPIDGRLQAAMARIWAWSHDAKVVISGQSGLGIDDKINLWTFPNCFIGLTNYQCAWAKKYNPFIKIVKIPNGVDLDKFNPTVKPIKINLPKPIVLSVGALETIKRQDLIIEQIAQTRDSLLIVGKGSLEKEIYNLGIKMLGQKRFKIMSFSHDEMPKVYTACDRLIFKSEAWESFGIVILEARASGLPVEVPTDPIRQEIVSTDLQEFSWQNIASQYNSLFKSL